MTDMDLIIGSINTRGLGDRFKRREIFNWLKYKKMSVYFIQEAHCMQDNTHDWRAEWGYQALFSCCSSNKAGVAILFNNNFSFQLLKAYTDPKGRFIICDLTTNGKYITLANIYAPNEDDPNFFTSVFNRLLDFKCEEIIVGGDLNLVVDVNKDKKGGLARSHKKSLEVINDFSENLDLIDAWRVLNPECSRFTWRQKKPEVHCRLDFFLVNQTTFCNIVSADILPGYKTDHSMITLQISLHSNNRGRGFWKLNTSFLNDIEYVNRIKLIINQTKAEYVQDDTVNPNLLWEMVKMKVREESLKYGTSKKKKLTKKEEEIEQAIASLEKCLSEFKGDETQRQKVWSELETKKRELEAIIEYRTKGAILRSKSQWYNEGEKNTKYFLNLEKRHCKQGTISQLKVNDNDLIYTDKEILKECESFYRNLYSSKVATENQDGAFFFPQQKDRTLLNSDEQSLCEGELSIKECLEALKSMVSDKSPGTDGLPCEFYKVFWKDVAEILINSFNYSYEIGKLSISQRRGIIKLIPKKDANLNSIKNWRPLTLLNCDYKIATKAIASRIKMVLPKLVSNDQTGFIRDRFIGENIRLIDSVSKYTKAKNMPGLLLFLDFEKAFDTLEWPFIRKTFEHFGFGPTLLNWLKVFYCNSESCILNNGWASNFFELSRGVRQGCPLSPYLFILSVEVLANAIRQKKEIRGIRVKDKEIKLSQYADDTTLILDGSEESFLESLKVIDYFGNISGLRLNSKKTEALWIGASADWDFKLCPQKDFKWPKKKVRALGVWLSTDPDVTISLNYKDKIEKTKLILGCWKLRRLSLLGKITVLKSLIASQLVYIFSPLETNHAAIRDINVMFYNFLWNGKGDKIKRNIMINDYSEGGLKMIDIASFNRSLKATWIKKVSR